MAADYTIIQKSSFSLGNPRTFDINLFSGFHTGSRTVLTFNMGSVKGDDTTLKLRVTINGTPVYSYDSNVDRPGHWAVQQVIAANVLRPNRQNRIRFERLGGGGEPLTTVLVKIANVVLWGHDTN
jgi:hypothetical protein